MTQDEAREIANRFGTRMCDENGEAHGEELYCLGLDDIIELTEALAQPEQEPVIDKSAAKRIATALGWEPKRTWVGLTDSEIGTIAYNVNPLDGIRQFSRAIEAKLKEKNT